MQPCDQMCRTRTRLGRIPSSVPGSTSSALSPHTKAEKTSPAGRAGCSLGSRRVRERGAADRQDPGQTGPSEIAISIDDILLTPSLQYEKRAK